MAPYSDRVHAVVAAPPALRHAAYLCGGRYGEHRTDRWRRPPVITAESTVTMPVTSLFQTGSHVSDAQVLRLVHLCDATLPTGGFAHSGGLEAALQLGLLVGRGDAAIHGSLREVGTAAVLSAAQQQAPFALAAHARVSDALTQLCGSNDTNGRGATSAESAEVALVRALHDLNAQQHALMVANAPGCRASLQLGGALVRIARNWTEAEPRDDLHGRAQAAAVAARAMKLRSGTHGALALGALAALLDLPAHALLGAFVYTSARDLISAAVRLNLVGPLAAVMLQEEIVSEVVARSVGVHDLECAKAAGSAPLLEAAHACHDLLERRIFQT